MIKKTFGELVVEQGSKPEFMSDDDLIEYRRSLEPDIIKEVQFAVMRNKDKKQYINKDFYIVLMFQMEPFTKQRKKVFFARMSCPTPLFAQSCWKYMRNSGCLEFLWSLPRPMLYYDVIKHGPQYLSDPSTSDMAKTCFLMESGELLDWVIKENGEKIDAVIKINKEIK